MHIYLGKLKVTLDQRGVNDIIIIKNKTVPYISLFCSVKQIQI